MSVCTLGSMLGLATRASAPAESRQQPLFRPLRRYFWRGESPVATGPMRLYSPGSGPKRGCRGNRSSHHCAVDERRYGGMADAARAAMVPGWPSRYHCKRIADNPAVDRPSTVGTVAFPHRWSFAARRLVANAKQLLPTPEQIDHGLSGAAFALSIKRHALSGIRCGTLRLRRGSLWAGCRFRWPSGFRRRHRVGELDVPHAPALHDRH